MVTRPHNLTKYPKILGLPPEILIHVLSYLEWYQLVSVQAISHRFRELVRNSVELRYIIELGADRLVHNDLPHGSPPLTIQDRLNLLLDKRRRWRMIDWTNQTIIPLPGSCQAYELVGGVFAKSMRGVVAEMWPPASRLFTAARLPTREVFKHGNTYNMKGIVQEDLGIWTRDFAIDPTQDLLVLLDVNNGGRIKVHVRAFSTMGIHPDAPKSPLYSEAPPTENPQELQINNCFLQIVGDIIGMFYWQSGHCLRVWNWKTGNLITCQNELDLPMGCWDLTFLSSRAYMITCAGETGSLDLYAINDPSPTNGEIQPPTRVLRLRLPELRPHRHLRTINTHSAPHLARPEALDSPFVQHQNLRVHLVQLMYGDLMPNYTMYVKNEYLLDLMDQVHERRGVYRDLQPDNAGTYYVDHFAPPGNYLPWEDWGPTNTRFLQQDLRFQWLRYVNGYRVVMPPSAANGISPQDVQRHTELCIYDFNVHPKRIDDPCDALMARCHREHEFNTTADNKSEWTYEVRTKETEIPHGNLFVEPVKSSLPYSIARLTGVSGYTGFMIDEQRLVGMKDNSSNDLAASDIDVFTF